MKKIVYIVLSLTVAVVLCYYSLIAYYTFIDVDPWGVERYLTVKGLKHVSVHGDWVLQGYGYAKPSKLIGEFSQYTEIRIRCKEFDVADIASCYRLKFLDVGYFGILRNFELLKHMNLFQVVGSVEKPIVDPELLSIIKQHGWDIRLIASTNNVSQICTCPMPEAYDQGLDLDIDSFKCASQSDIENLRRQAFLCINDWNRDDFWEIFDSGIFPHRASYYDIRNNTIREIPESEALEIIGRL